MKPFCLLIMLVWRSSIFWSFGSTEDEVAIFLQGGIPQIFEGIPASLICVTKSTYSNITWTKDGIEIARCLNEMLEVKDLPPGVSVFPGRNDRTMNLFCIMDFTNLTISDHNGSYTCLAKTSAGASKAETYNFTIRERKPFCEPEPVEYLVNDLAILSCHNPNYFLNRSILWLRDNTDDGLLSLQSTEYEYTNRLNAVVKMESRFNKSVFSCHAFFTQEQFETLTGKDNYSCSVGPVFVYDTPFLSIVEVNDTVQNQKEGKLVNCRLVPSTLEAKVRWQLPPSTLPFTISTLGTSSNITFSGIGAFQGKVVNVTCEGFYDGFNISSVYSLSFATSSNRNPVIPPGDKPGFLSPLYIVLGALVVLILIAIIVCLCIIIRKFQRPKENQDLAYANDASFRKDQTQMGNDTGAVELELQRYQPEPFKTSQSPSQLNDQMQYDIPPFGDHNGETPPLNLSQGGYESNDRIYDPATEGPTEYYQMGDDVEEYTDISEVMRAY